MNRFIAAQINNMIATATIFEQSCKTGALKDDGKIDREEEKVLKKVLSATKTYSKALKSALSFLK